MACASPRFVGLPAILVLLLLSADGHAAVANNTTAPGTPVVPDSNATRGANATAKTPASPANVTEPIAPVPAPTEPSPKESGSSTVSPAVIGAIGAACAALFVLPLVFCILCGCCPCVDRVVHLGFLERQYRRDDLENPSLNRKVDVRGSDNYSEWSGSTPSLRVQTRGREMESESFSHASRSS
jgi:hypothetical protein